MTPALSAIVDLFRAAAALVVLFGHLDALGFVPLALGGRPNRLGHDAVIAFFVLSGLVIAHAASTTQRDARRFAVARASRLYSVAVPAVLATLVLDRVGIALDPTDYPLWQYAKWPLHAAWQWLFLGEIWSGGPQVPFSNVPYWSLGYEAWYYLLFGVATFLRGAPRVLAASVVLIAAGPKLWLLLPAWAAGVALHRALSDPARPRGGALAAAPGPAHPARWALPVTLLAAAAYVGWVASGAQAAVEAIGQELLAGLGARLGVAPRVGYSRFFLADWVTAALFTAMLAAVARSGAALPGRLAAIGRALAAGSFSLYLLHYPLLMLLRATGAFAPGWGSTTAAAAIVLGAVAAFAWAFEQRREPWRRLFDAAWSLAARWRRPRRALR